MSKFYTAWGKRVYTAVKTLHSKNEKFKDTRETGHIRLRNNVSGRKGEETAMQLFEEKIERNLQTLLIGIQNSLEASESVKIAI